MVRKLFSLGLLSLVSVSLGCAMCCSPDDPNYGAYGGRWQRHDLMHGRVGSAFNDAGYDILAEATDASEELQPGEPEELQPGDDGIAESAPTYDDAETELVSFIR